MHAERMQTNLNNNTNKTETRIRRDTKSLKRETQKKEEAGGVRYRSAPTEVRSSFVSSTALVCVGGRIRRPHVSRDRQSPLRARQLKSKLHLHVLLVRCIQLDLHTREKCEREGESGGERERREKERDGEEIEKQTDRYKGRETCCNSLACSKVAYGVNAWHYEDHCKEHQVEAGQLNAKCTRIEDVVHVPHHDCIAG